MSGALPRRDTTEDKPRHQTPFKQQLILGSLSRSSSATNSAKKTSSSNYPAETNDKFAWSSSNESKIRVVVQVASDQF